MTLESGKILCNDYELIEPIGHGGMGAIWRAKDLPGKREVALKFVPRDVQNFESEMDRVEDVFAVIEKLHHQHICPLYAMKDAGGTHGKFLVMQFIPGLPLGKFARQVRRKTGDFTVARLVSVLRPIASALDYAHTRRPPVIHRDIKPANILVVADDDLRVVDVQLIDFGIAATFRASLTRVSQVQLNTSGTRPYMAPEQWDGAYQNAATDQYALGITAYELLSGGQFPFDSDDFQILKECVKTSPVPPIETLSRAQNQVISRALAKKREDRFPSCTEFIDALAKAPSENYESDEATINDLPPSDPFASFFAAEEAKEAARRAKLPELALDAYQAGKHAEAAEYLREYLKYHPENENAKRLLERCAARRMSSSAEVGVSGSRLRPEQEVSGSDLSPQNRSAGDRKVLTASGIDYAFRWCPPGEFMMGSPSNELGRDDDEQQHKVKITRGFWLMETEVTRAMWESVMGENPSRFKGPPTNPVECVSWDDCQEFCRILGQKLGQQVQLPTEAQWEYACRAGTTGAYAGNLDDMGWYYDNSGSKTHAVGLKKPNAWGLYDMHGNVWEWCLDWYDEDYYAESPTSDPAGPNSGTIRVSRGGGWDYGASGCRSADRDGSVPGDRSSILGLRALVVPAQ